MSDLPVSKKQRLKLDLKAAHIALREVSKHAEGETLRADRAEAERDALSEMLRGMARRVGKRRDEQHHYATRLMEAYECQNDLRAKLDKQRKRRKTAEAKVIVLESMIRSYRDCLLLTRLQLDDARKEAPDA